MAVVCSRVGWGVGGDCGEGFIRVFGELRGRFFGVIELESRMWSFLENENL